MTRLNPTSPPRPVWPPEGRMTVNRLHARNVLIAHHSLDPDDETAMAVARWYAAQECPLRDDERTAADAA